jgi:hypothetical protein
LDLIATTREGAHQAATEAYRVAQQLIAGGKRVRIQCAEDEDDRTLAANRYYWGVILREISEQAAIEGQRYAAEAWHELFKRQFLGYEVKKVRVAGKKRQTVIRKLRSTTDLSVKKFSKYLEQIQAFATGDLGVAFSSDWFE